MFDLIKKIMLTGIGLTLQTKEEVEDLAKELVNKGEISEKEGKKLIEDLQKKWEASRNKLKERVENYVNEVLKKTNLVTREELMELKKEVIKLKKSMEK